MQGTADRTVTLRRVAPLDHCHLRDCSAASVSCLRCPDQGILVDVFCQPTIPRVMASDISPKPLPPYRGRAATLDILRQPVATHEISEITLPHPARLPTDPQSLPFRVFRAIPRAKPEKRGFPVLYMLDGTAAFDYLTPGLLEGVPGLAVIGIGYAGDAQFARNDRVFDYTPPKVPGGAPFADPHHGGRIAGGAERFADALTGPLRQAAESGLAVDPARRSLWGHSLGGLCTLFVALTRPGAFARYMPASPSIWWNEPLMQDLVAQARFDPAQPTPIHLVVGDREQRTGTATPPPIGPPPITMALADRLAAKPGVIFSSEVHEGAVHIATLPSSQPGALRRAAE
ncbi:alpha/beta hydrolase [Sinirhodobacter populi]|uniref:Alpha/beta hydrolase n=2 Tax=Paenirhodobacter populi TaxID=2306993 RepID=A0A443JT17_9RHOB|nr:alpha/beta hydrolase [Sinirhodobacter populi]